MYKPVIEAEKIYFSIFNSKIPEAIQHRFSEISQTIDNNYRNIEVSKYYTLIPKIRDLEALELAARHFGKLPILTEKFKIMIYLSETIPQNYGLFINENPKSLYGYVAITASVIRSILKMVKGVLIILIYKI